MAAPVCRTTALALLLACHALPLDDLYERDAASRDRRFVVTAGCPGAYDAAAAVRLFVAVPSAAHYATRWVDARRCRPRPGPGVGGSARARRGVATARRSRARPRP